jgi:hypothetical protein
MRCARKSVAPFFLAFGVTSLLTVSEQPRVRFDAVRALLATPGDEHCRPRQAAMWRCCERRGEEKLTAGAAIVAFL